MTSLSNNEKAYKIYREEDDLWKKILFVFNPVSGRTQIKSDLMEILEIFSREGYRVECYPTKCSGDARRLIRNMQSVGNHERFRVKPRHSHRHEGGRPGDRERAYVLL